MHSYLNIIELVKLIKKDNEERKRLKYSNRLIDLKDRTCNMVYNSDIAAIQSYANDIKIWILNSSVPIKHKRKFLKPESERGDFIIPYLRYDGYLGRETFQAFQNILLSLDGKYVNNNLASKKLCIANGNTIYTACIMSDINVAEFKDLHYIVKLFHYIRDDMYAHYDLKMMKHHKKMDEEQRKIDNCNKTEVSPSSIKELEDFCKSDGTKFEVVKKGSSTVMTLNGEELPKTTDRSKDFHNGYIEGFRRAIVIVQRIMGFKLFNNSKPKKGKGK